MNIQYLKQIFNRHNITIDFDIDAYDKEFIFLKFNNNGILQIMDFEDITNAPINYLYKDNQKYYRFSYLSTYLIVSNKFNIHSHTNVICIHTNDCLDIVDIELLSGKIVNKENYISLEYNNKQIILNCDNINMNNDFDNKYFICI